MYAGNSPFHLCSHPEINNPVLTCGDVTDRPAILVADPFMVHVDKTWFMFFEVMHKDTRRGEIGLATSADGVAWTYKKIVLTEPFHLSYPYVFKWGEDYYMIPETRQAGAVRLYRAAAFPSGWRYESTLLDIAGTDPSIFRYANTWWMFLCTPPLEHASLKLYMADELTGPWREHPRNPIVRQNPGIARPAGRVTVVAGKVIRYAQDCEREYGTRVRAFEVTELTPETYIEQESRFSPVLEPAGSGWNSEGMHHLDLHASENSWIACVDGWAYRYEPCAGEAAA